MKVLIIILVVLLALALLVGIAALLYRHFVTNRVSDWGGMENPDYSGEAYIADEPMQHPAAQKTL